MAADDGIRETVMKSNLAPLATAIVLTGLLAAGSASAAATDCDRLAAAPNDPERPAGVAGVAIVAIDMEKAVPACRAALAATPDDPRIKYQLARALSLGNEAAVKESNTLLRQSAEAGYPSAMYYFGFMVEYGFGFPRDEAAAIEWYRKAAAAEFPRAMVAMGKVLLAGKGITADPPAAVEWFRRGADAGDPEAMVLLGGAYEEGDGVERNMDTARSWYRNAISAGSSAGQVALDRLERLHPSE